MPDPSCHHRKLKNSLVFSLAFQEDILITSPLSSTLLWKLDLGILLYQIPKTSSSYEVSGLIRAFPLLQGSLCCTCSVV